MIDSILSSLRTVAETEDETTKNFVEAETKETQRLQQEFATARARRLGVSSSLSSSSPSPLSPSTSLTSPSVSSATIPPLLLARPKPDTAGAACMAALNRAARAIEAQQLLRCVVQWEHVCHPLWKALASEAAAENARRSTAPLLGISNEEAAFQLSYGGFAKIAKKLDPMRDEALQRLFPQHRGELAAEADAAAAEQEQQQSQTAVSQHITGDATAAFTAIYRTIPPADNQCDIVEANLLELYSEFLPRIDASLFLACPRQAKTGTVDIRVLYENLQIQIAVAKFAAEMLLMDDVGDRTLHVDQFEAYVEDTLSGIPGFQEVVRRQLVDAHKTAHTERFVWLLDKRNQGRFDLRQMLAIPDLKYMLVHQLKPEELSSHPVESVRWFACGTTIRLFDEFNRLDQRRKRRLALGDMRKYRKFLDNYNRGNNANNGPLSPEVSPISFSFIKRYFEVTPTYDGELDFRCFIHFVLNVESLPTRCPRAGLFFDIFDADGFGVLTPTRMSRFLCETRAKLSAEFDSYGATAERQVDDLFHLIKTETVYEITRREFIASPNAGLFCALAIDTLALLAYEQRDWTNPKLKQEELMQRPFSGRR